MADQEETCISPPLLSSNRLQVADVYEIATKIGREFQKIIDEYGSPSVTNIIPMVVGALEQLENVVEENEQFRVEHCTLAIQSDKLKEELKKERKLRAKRLEEQDEISAALEEKCRQFEELQQSNYKLHEEAKQLEAVLAQQNNAQALESERNKNAALLSNIEELQSSLDRANERLKSSKSLIAEKDKEISRLSTDVDTLFNQLANYQKKIPSRKDYRNDLTDTLDGKELTVYNEPEQVIEEDSEPVDKDPLKQAEERIEMLEREKLEMQQEQMTLKKELAEANQKLVVANESSGQAFTSLPANVTQPKKEPTFYKEDLLRVLEDRDQLGMKVAELEDELKLLRPETKEDSRRRGGSSFFNKQPEPTKPSKVKEILESLTVTVTVNDKAQKTSL